VITRVETTMRGARHHSWHSRARARARARVRARARGRTRPRARIRLIPRDVTLGRWREGGGKAMEMNFARDFARRFDELTGGAR